MMIIESIKIAVLWGVTACSKVSCGNDSKEHAAFISRVSVTA
jgi:hypothetical protein